MLEIPITLGAKYRVKRSDYEGIASGASQRYCGHPTVVLERTGDDGSTHAWEVPIGRVERID